MFCAWMFHAWSRPRYSVSERGVAAAGCSIRLLQLGPELEPVLGFEGRSRILADVSIRGSQPAGVNNQWFWGG